MVRMAIALDQEPPSSPSNERYDQSIKLRRPRYITKRNTAPSLRRPTSTPPT